MDRVEVQAMLLQEDRHWWYRGRRQIVCDELARLPTGPTLSVLEAGCGSGRLLDELRDYGHVAGVDLNADSVEIARSRGHEDVVQGPVEQLPWDDETFDLVVSMDMVEHTPDDRATLRELRRVTKQGGHFVMTVPALRALWSTHDVFNNHHRRYDRKMARSLAADTGWTIERMTYFNSLLLPPAAAVRLLQRVRHRDVVNSYASDAVTNDSQHGQHSSESQLTPPWMYPVLVLPMKLEAKWLDGRRTLPAGLSLLTVMRRV